MHVPQKGSLAGARLRGHGNVGHGLALIGPSAAPLAVRFCSAAQVKQAALEDPLAYTRRLKSQPTYAVCAEPYGSRAQNEPCVRTE